MPLNDVQLRQLKAQPAPYRISDGGGLFIEVKPTGSKLWRLAYRFGGKQKLLALGSYPETPLARAREKRLEAKALLQEGIDPSAKAKADKEEHRALVEDTFSAIAAEMLDKAERDGRAGTTMLKKRWLIDMVLISAEN